MAKNLHINEKPELALKNYELTQLKLEFLSLVTRDEASWKNIPLSGAGLNKLL
jgi:hypothetical protein